MILIPIFASKMFKFADDAKLCHRARNPDDITVRYINRLIECSNKWQMNFNVDICTVIQIGHNNMPGNYNMSDQQLPKTENSGIEE